MPNTNRLNIKSWAEEDRPREKFLSKGKEALSDAELIAILIGSGSRSESAVQLAQRILASAKQNLHQLGKLSVGELMKFKGIGEAKAISIAAALELGRRRKDSESLQRRKIQSSQTAYEEIADVLSDLPHEEFWVMYMNRANELIGRKHISKGGVSGTVADVKIILKQALELLSSSLIVCHNHPSGNLKPSQEDIQLTKKISEAAKNIDMKLLDHIIVGNNAYFSFADEGLI
ncbi:MAG: hypothetical protein CMO34_05345 [Verrucomicrobia bacterium]|nr:hypothetical protein [Verrucomicrobiota bacterium]|tara:strand:+ start:4484 stop:5179 length:696 start_codon:yes stop_codon:yes gene_type:complete